jgi:Xaa-Pro dipeptidase
MQIQRRHFIKLGGLSAVGWGTLPAILSSCKLKPLMSLENMTEGIEPLQKEDYEKRLARAQALLEQYSIDGLLITGGTNMQYFLNMSWWQSERMFGAIINRTGDPIWICPAFELERAEEIIQFGNDIRTWEEHESPYTLITDAMNSLTPRGGVLGIGPAVRNFFVEGIRRELPGTGLELVDGAVITEGCRGIKDEKELVYMDLANRITKKAYREAFQHAREGMASQEMASLIREAHQQMGTSGGGYPLFGPGSAFPHGTRERHDLAPGDTILVDGGCSVEGYRSDVTRTIFFGTPSDKQKRVFETVLKAQQEAQKAVRPGVPCETIDNTARKFIEEAGFGPGYKYFTHRLGHGIGMEGHEYPYLVKGNTLELQPGMTFSNEPGIYIYGEFGVRIEDCFVVTADGSRVLGEMSVEDIEQPFGL